MSKNKGRRWRGHLANALLVFFSLACVFIPVEAILRYREHKVLRAGQMVEFTTDPAFFGVQSLDIGAASEFRWDRDGNGPLHIRSENPVLVYELRPGARISSAVRINPQGFRDDPFSQEKPEGVFRIALLGDSISYGWGVRLEDTYASVLERLLNQHCQGYERCEVYNFSVGGYNAAQELELLRTKVMRYQPDLLLVQYCTNDGVIGADAGLLRHFTRTWSHTYDFLSLRVRGLLAGDVMGLSYQGIASLCANERLPVAAILFPDASPGGARIPTDERMIQQCGILTFFLGEAFDSVGLDVLLNDDLHPNMVGHYIAAEEIYRFLLNKPELGLVSGCQTLPHNGSEARTALARAIQAQREGQGTVALANYSKAAEAAPAYTRLAAHALAASSEALRVRGQTEEALRLARQAAAFDPKSARVQAILASALASQGRFAEAATAFRAAMHASDRNAILLQGLANSLYATGDAVGAARAYAELFEGWKREYEDLVEAAGQGGIPYASYRENGRPASWEILVPMGPQEAAPAIQIFLDAEEQCAAAGETGRAKEMRAKAQQTYRLANALSAGEAYLHETYATGMEKRGDFDAAIQAYRRAKALDEENVSIRTGLARCLLATGKEVEGRELLRQAVMMAPERVAEIVPGLTPEHGLIATQDALSAAPHDLPLHLLCAQFHRDVGDLKAAAKALEDALALAPQDQALRFNLCATWLDAQELDKGMAALSEAVQQDPKCRPAAAKALLEAGETLLSREDWTKAAEAFIAVLRWDKSLAGEAAALCIGSGQELLDSARNEEAAWLYEKAHAFNPADYNACSGWGKALALTEGIERSIAFYRQTAAQHTEWKGMLAQELITLGTDRVAGEDYEDAAKALRAAALLNPSRSGEAALVLQSGAEAHSEAGRIAAAAALYRQAAETAPVPCDFYGLAAMAINQASGPKEALVYLGGIAPKGDGCAYTIEQIPLEMGRELALLEEAVVQDAAKALVNAARIDTNMASYAAETLAAAGQTRLTAGDAKASEYLYAMACTIAPEEPRFIAGHAESLAKLDRFQEAVLLLTNAQGSAQAANRLFDALLERWVELTGTQDWSKTNDALLAATRTLPEGNDLFLRWHWLRDRGLPLDEAMRTYRREAPRGAENEAAWIKAARIYRAVGLASAENVPQGENAEKEPSSPR